MKAWIARLFGIKTCQVPGCGNWSARWCNTRDWYDDGDDCNRKDFR